MLKRILAVGLVLVVMTACHGSTKDSKGVIKNSDGTIQYGEGGTKVVPGTQEDLVAYVGDRVFFEYDSAVLSSNAQSTLARQAEWLKNNAKVTVTIEGHCDERGTREYNLALGERRANAVKKYLISLGVDKKRISTVSYGKERPEVVGASDTSWSKNRRGVTRVN